MVSFTRAVVCLVTEQVDAVLALVTQTIVVSFHSGGLQYSGTMNSLVFTFFIFSI